MKRFRTYIITKNTLIKFSIFFVIVIIAVTFFIIWAVKSEKKDSIAVFSYNAEKIIDKGVISDKKTDTIKETVEEILGFDKDDPISIINSSSVEYEQINKENHTPPPPSPIPTEKSIRLATQEEINNSRGLKINNATNYEIDIDDLCKNALDIKLELKEPEVLIVHTHTTECYNGDEMAGESERTTNEQYNMCHIGDIVSKKLEEHGIKTIHDKTIHDYPSYQGAYTRALKTIEKNIAEYPSIKVVLDIHRDAYIYADGSKLRVSTDDGAAQVMLVLGTDSMGLEHNYWQSNLTLAAKVQNAAEIMYPGLMRPLNLRRERFNMHLTKGSLLLEIGSNGNSIKEAEKAAVYIANAIASVLING